MPGLFFDILILGTVHPSLRIIALVTLAIALQFIHGWILFAAGVLVSVVALAMYPTLGWRMLYRSRWLLLMLLLIFSFTTPGEYARGWPIAIAPSYEGIIMGLLQAGRLVIMLSSLALLLGTTDREALMSGIYMLMQPLKYLGLAPERFTARLWLTLHYVEQTPEKRHRSKWSLLDELALNDHAEEPRRLVLTMPELNWIDGLVLSVAGGYLLWWVA